ncbi:Maleamate amidohydrolase [Roseivivax jejudonensis]|uniref:Maleamate amidohydrolase n=1 Tax=Roseivivax jejudonensis TaxID=1529041 RepID=A0A1X6ZX90_9RHOB|nr:isochorismatase family cysteine hydrolase [Roseivivax jejudonensis]SLN63985.1 Maleamate amidohydrolase [Roseivivax jejudonensis]
MTRPDDTTTPAAPWEAFLTDADRRVREVAGYGADGPRPARPVLLVIDMTYDFCGPEGADAVSAARAVRTACGPAAWAAVPRIAQLIAAARAAGVPVIYTRRDAARLAARRTKTARGAEDDPAGNEIVAPLAPAPGDVVLGKSKPSAFWATDLDDRLAALGADGVIVAGCTSSGCVRATAVDAYNRDLPCLVVADAVFDRFESSHALALFDLQAKYADLVDTGAAVALLSGDHASVSQTMPR